MNSFYRAKFDELFMEFTRYFIEHPEFAECIPEDAQVVLLDRQDPVYSQQAIEFSAQARETDDMAGRPIVYIEVTEMAPVRSRMQEIRVLHLPPIYAAAWKKHVISERKGGVNASRDLLDASSSRSECVQGTYCSSVS